MLCCIGLIGGAAVGQYLGGPWTLIAPAAGFGLGLVGDMKLMKRLHGGGGHSHLRAEPGKYTDPVCGMEVHESAAPHQLQHMGSTYHFCAPGCKEAFEANPEKYIGKAQKAA